MKFAVVGAGVIGDLHAQTITNLSGAEVSVVVDVQFERAQDLAGRHGARPLSDISAALSLPDMTLWPSAPRAAITLTWWWRRSRPVNTWLWRSRWMSVWPQLGGWPRPNAKVGGG